MRFFLTLLSFLLLNWNCLFAQTWVEQIPSGSYRLQSLSTVDENTAWICGLYGLVLSTTDGGYHWYYHGNKPPFYMAHLGSIFAINRNTAFVTSTYNLYQNQYTELYKTSDGGLTWQTVFEQNGGYIDDFAFKDSLNGFLLGDPVGGRWSLWSSTNGGLNWDSSGLYLPDAGGEASFNKDLYVQNDSIWFGTNLYRIYRSTNFGLKWTYSTVSCPYILTLSVSGTLGFAGYECAFKTTDAGLSWEPFTLPFYIVFSFDHIGEKYWWFAGWANIFYSEDSGKTFLLQYSVPGQDGFMEISMRKIDNIITGWAITDKGSISKYTEPSGIHPIFSEVPSDYNLYQNYPNPFNPTTTIRYDIPKSGEVSINVYDLLGKEIYSLNEFKVPGSYSFKFDGTNFPSGIYFYMIEARDFVSTKKMVLIK
jgi:photosystem II stability/assembly factor-like uncharacterized protein